MTSRINRIMEAPLGELRDILLRDELSPVERAYGELLYHYLSGDTEKLGQFAIPHSLSATEASILGALMEARCKLRSLTLTENDTAALVDASGSFPEPWRSESLFILGMMEESLGKDGSASSLYGRAASGFSRLGMKRKFVKALQNQLAADSRIHKDRRFLVEFQHLYRRALRAGEKQVAGVAMNNLSREYQNIGAMKTALKASHRAISLLREDFGSLHHEQALAHRCHLLFEMKRDAEAESMLEMIRKSPFPEIRAAVSVIEGLRAGHAKDTASAATPMKTWRDRAQSDRLQPRDRLPELEEKLLQFLSLRPHTRYDLVEAIYGSQIDPESALNRLKNLLNRLRKKFPGLIVLEDGRYRIADPDFLPRSLKKSG